MGKKAALYIRVSTDAQFEEGYSVDAQKEMLAAYCVTKGWKNYEFYIDGGFTGSNIERPALKRLIEDVKQGNISAVVVYKLDRLSRSQKDTLYLIEDVFNPAGAAFTSLNENLDTATPMGRAMLGIMSAFAQLERETIRERTRMGMKERVKEGLWMGGGRTPFGYDYDRAKGVLVPNEDAQTVQRIYDLYLAGWSAARIAEAVGLRHDKQVRDILTRRSNTGVIFYNGVEYPGKHEAIIDEAIFEKAMRMMRDRSDRRLLTSDRLLTGLTFCGRCGARMRYQKWGDKGYKLSCYSQQTSKKYLIHDPDCDNPKPWADEVEEAVVDDFLGRTLEETGTEEEDRTVSAVQVMEAQLQQAQKKLARLYSLYAERDDDVLLDSIDAQRKLISDLQARIEREKAMKADEQARAQKQEEIRQLRQAWPHMTVDERRAVLREAIEKVEIDGERIDISYRI